MRIARCEISFGNFRSALSYLDQGLTHEPSNSSLRLEKARLTRVEKVIENIKQLIAERKFVEALGTLGCDILKGCHFAQLCNLQVFCFCFCPPTLPTFFLILYLRQDVCLE